MTDRDRFTLHILPGMPATREGAMRGPRVKVRSVDALKELVPILGAYYMVMGNGESYRFSPDPIGPDNTGSCIGPPKRKKPRKK